MYSYRTDYAQWVLHPEQVKHAMAHTLLAGERSASHGHVVLLRQLTKLVGLHDPELMGGLDKARRLEAAGKPFVMMTLTNDHLPSSEKDHDTLNLTLTKVPVGSARAARPPPSSMHPPHPPLGTARPRGTCMTSMLIRRAT